MNIIGLSLGRQKQIFTIFIPDDTMRSLSILFVILLFAAPSFSQSLANLDNSVEVTKKLVNFSSEDWSFFHDEDTNLFFIDFETVDVNLSDLKVINQAGDVIITEKLQNLPVNTIFELDLSPYPSGIYLVEIRTFTNTITKEITVR